MLPLATFQKFHPTFNAIPIHMLEVENLLFYPRLGKLFSDLALGLTMEIYEVFLMKSRVCYRLQIRQARVMTHISFRTVAQESV
jgi:hypothetical protein